jgi:hypothetical protein
MKKQKLIVTLNGTDENPYRHLGVRYNPFPQIATAEAAPHCRHLQKLAGDPIPDTDYIRKHLEGWDPEFIELCCSRFEKGKTVSFVVFWPEGQ